ncbi:DUF2860 family protein [Aestuariirhabdus sp. LZHN29]|uniref:DUF2860 family protein n=1 Tax=Aestuariirhabdus sp. LZHN29 TaxID=3417462 RepID=UPI003CE8B765
MILRSMTTLSCLTLLASGTALATPIPQESGISGYVGFGAASSKLESNMIHGTSLTDFDNKRAKNLTSSPSSESDSSGFFTGEIRYTWADTRTQVFVGNTMIDALRYDAATLIGVRQEVGNSGTIGAAYMLSSFPIQVWKDPYQTGVKRSDTDQTSDGVLLSWDGILGSNFDGQISFRDVDVDDEFSGTALGLSAANRNLLKRDGDDTSSELLYRWKIADGHTLIPALRYTDRDRDGGAMRSEDTGVQLGYLYSGSSQWNLKAHLYAGSEEFDKHNPISAFGFKKRDDDIVGANVTAFYNEPMGWKDWRVMAAATSYESDSNIDFYDSKVQSFTLGMLYNF